MTERAAVRIARRARVPRAAWCALVGVLLAGCAPDLPPLGPELPDVEGRWSYSATNVRISDAPAGDACAISGLVLTLGRWTSAGLTGRSEGGRLTCSGRLAALDGPIASYSVRRGGMVAQHIAFDLGTADWRHEGTLDGDSIYGIFRLRSGSLNMDGRFVAHRQRP